MAMRTAQAEVPTFADLEAQSLAMETLAAAAWALATAVKSSKLLHDDIDPAAELNRAWASIGFNYRIEAIH
jgi:hypothetical protein